jgi:hypothetical protein
MKGVPQHLEALLVYVQVVSEMMARAFQKAAITFKYGLTLCVPEQQVLQHRQLHFITIGN